VLLSTAFCKDFLEESEIRLGSSIEKFKRLSDNLEQIELISSAALLTKLSTSKSPKIYKSWIPRLPKLTKQGSGIILVT